MMRMKIDHAGKLCYKIFRLSSSPARIFLNPYGDDVFFISNYDRNPPRVNLQGCYHDPDKTIHIPGTTKMSLKQILEKYTRLEISIIKVTYFLSLLYFIYIKYSVYILGR